MSLHQSELDDIKQLLKDLFPEDAFRAWIALKLLSDLINNHEGRVDLKELAQQALKAALALYPRKE